MSRFKRNIAVIAGLTMLSFAGALQAQNVGLTRIPVTKGEISIPDREAVISKTEIAAGGVAGWHTHPGDEMSYLMEGEMILTLAGQAPRKITAGEGFIIPAGVPHHAKNESATTTVKLLGVFAVEKGKPLASPATEPAK
ncbi:cupin domain-containing protein [soil metagenome]